MNFKDLFKGSKAAVDYQAAIGETESQLATIRGELAELQAGRGGVLLDGNDKALDALEADLRAKERDAERLTVVLAELRKRADQSAEREHQAALDKCFAEAAAAQRRGQALIASYQEHATAIAGILAELVAAEERIRAVNSELAEAGDPRRVKPAVFVPSGKGFTTDITRGVQLPATTGSSDRLWPPVNADGIIVSTPAGRERLRRAVG